MRVYIGQARGQGAQAKAIDREGFGEMCVREEFPPRRHPWAFDNGAFRDFSARKPFNAKKYDKALTKLAASGMRPDFLVVPDIVRGGRESLKFSATWAPRLQHLAPLYLVVQDGMEEAEVADSLERYAGIFVGGGDAFKLTTSERWVSVARARGLQCHIGRVTGPDKVLWARQIGADSIDSAQPLFTFAHMRRFIAAVHARVTPARAMRAHRAMVAKLAQGGLFE